MAPVRWASIAALALLGWVALPAAAAGSGERVLPGATPQDTLRRLYVWVLAHPSAGLPSARQRGQLSEMLTPSLVQLLKSAAETEQRCIRVTPKGDKGDIIEGDLFVGIYEGASEVAYGDLRTESSERVLAPVDLAFIDPRFPKGERNRTAIWRDTVVLQREKERWWVHDIQFGEHRSLVTTLNGYIEAGAKNCVAP